MNFSQVLDMSTGLLMAAILLLLSVFGFHPEAAFLFFVPSVVLLCGVTIYTLITLVIRKYPHKYWTMGLFLIGLTFVAGGFLGLPNSFLSGYISWFLIFPGLLIIFVSKIMSRIFQLKA